MKLHLSTNILLRDISGSQDCVAKPSTARDLGNNGHMDTDLDKLTSRTGRRSRARGTTSGHHQSKYPLGTGSTCWESQASVPQKSPPQTQCPLAFFLFFFFLAQGSAHLNFPCLARDFRKQFPGSGEPMPPSFPSSSHVDH